MLIAAASLLSCTSSRNNTLAYFKDLEASTNGNLPNPQGIYPIRIQPDDELVIVVTSAVPEATAAYNLPMDNPATRGNLRQTTQPRSQTYIVDDQGYIMMPVLGRIYVNGKTLNEISKDITAMVAKDVRDPYVRVDIVNFSVDVMGEVKNPQRVYSGHEHFTILDALSQCGDLTETTCTSSAPRRASAPTTAWTSPTAMCSTRLTSTSSRTTSCMWSPTRSASTIPSITRITPLNCRLSRPS